MVAAIAPSLAIHLLVREHGTQSGAPVDRNLTEMRQTLTTLLDDGPPFRVGQDVSAAREAFRERYYYKPDGNASKRMLDEITAYLEDRQRHRSAEV